MSFAKPLSQMTRAQSLRPHVPTCHKLINIDELTLAHLLPSWANEGHEGKASN